MDTGLVNSVNKRFPFEEVLAHPRHQAAQKSLVELIVQLRVCANVKDAYKFQQALLAEVLAVEAIAPPSAGLSSGWTTAHPSQAGAPEPQSGRDPALMETWQLELDICERVARQFRCLGDALAWRVLGFERRYILALCRNQPPRVMAGKVGFGSRARPRRTGVEGNWSVRDFARSDELPSDRGCDRVRHRLAGDDRDQDRRAAA